ncbi:CHAP domain-containing protein [Actinocorallia populi]|uniref:CHAP domain-containing protein n=1 Tax=Actinocorallia populi TaxID=2079200 RepID=UPI000D088BA3|nr:CHAP domain-containing protein [Actinocorallia populi]
MDPVGQKLLDIAKSELGYTEKAGGYTKFGDWWTKNIDEDANSYFTTAPWCDMFLAWAADKAGLTDFAGQFAATQDHASWFKDNDAWGTAPEPGAIVFFNWSGAKDIGSIQHVGIVEKVGEDGTVHTIEANTQDTLARRERDSSDIVGYGYPGKVEVAGMNYQETLAQQAYQPRHSAPAPSVEQLAQAPRTDTQAAVQARQDSGAADLPVKEAALTGVVGLAILGVLAAGLAKAAAVKVPAAVANAPEVRVRKRGRHHRTSGAPPVRMPAEMTRYDLEDAENDTLMMPAISAQVAQEVEDREFWGRIAHLKEDEELGFWTDLHSAVTQTAETNAQLTGRRP